MKYLKWYYNIINKAFLEKRIKSNNQYYEMHHIKPLSKGGKRTVLLTAREHFIVHLLLTKIYPKDKKLIYAFHMMFVTSDNQERYLPISKWYEYKRKIFIDNHPTKDVKIREYISKRTSETYWLKQLKENIGAFCEINICPNCGKLCFNGLKYCSKKCRISTVSKQNKKSHEKRIKKESKNCLICGKLHRKKYCCSKECFNIYVKQPNNEYSKNCSLKRSEYIKQNYDKIKIINKNIISKRDNSKVGEKISQTKRKNKSGNNLSSSFQLEIFNENNELIYDKPKSITLKEFCNNNNLSITKIKRSYLNNKRMSNGWKAIKIK